MRKLIAAVCVALVIGAAGANTGELTVTPADASVTVAAVDSPLTICNRWRPHGSSDTVFTADTYFLSAYYIKTQCIANHPGANHYYCVTTWWNGVESWTHPCFEGLG